MSSRFALLFTAALCAAVAACAAKRIPGTDIRDTADTRAIVALIDEYRGAAERRDAPAVLSLLSPQYYDDGGTAQDPTDDQDYAMLQKRLPEDYAKLSDVKLGIGVKAITVEGDKATADVFFEGRWHVTTASGEVPKTVDDVERMKFVRENGAWKITSGL